MNRISSSNFCVLLLIFIVRSATAQFTVNAGADKTICPGDTITIGGAPTATGGKAPYTYTWSPATRLTGTTLSNPAVYPLSDISYTVSVRDDTGAIKTDVVTILMNYLYYVDAGMDTTMCVTEAALIGGKLNTTGKGITYTWAPSIGLNDSTLPRPTANPLTTTVYKLTAILPGCKPKTDLVTVNIIPTPPVNAGKDTTIKQGERAILHASGGYFYVWAPQNTLTYYYTANPDAEPITTTTYFLYGMDASNTCPNFDTVTVFVEPSDEVVFYNTFTPNGDGNNDTWYIGNILNFPDNKLEIYNRYGKLIYKVKGYSNNWDGKAFGEELPAATYFYNMDLGNGKKFHGTVTIVK